MTVELNADDRILVTGAAGLVGSHFIEAASRRNLKVRALVRSKSLLPSLCLPGVEQVIGDLAQPEALTAAAEGVTHIVHCAAKVGDWGPTAAYRAVNVTGLQALLAAAEKRGGLKKFVHISSLGVYEARDHYGTDETEEPKTQGIDGYTLTKVEAEQLVRQTARSGRLNAICLRPGFIYGPRDRTVIPRLLEKLKSGQFAYLGSPDKLMNNTYVGNLVEAIFLAIESDVEAASVFNITDGRLVSKREFIDTIARCAKLKLPSRVVPLPIASSLAEILERVWKLMGKTEAPLVSKARIKFLGRNLDFCIDRAKHQLKYVPPFDFQPAMETTIASFLQPQSK